MAQTRSALINAVLDEIGALAAGQTASAEDVAAVDGRIDPVLADLRDRGVIDVITEGDAGDLGPSGGAFADGPFNHVVRVIAEYVAPKFGRSADQAAIEFSERKLRTLSRIGKGSGSMLRVDRALRSRRR